MQCKVMAQKRRVICATRGATSLPSHSIDTWLIDVVQVEGFVGEILQGLMVLDGYSRQLVGFELLKKKDLNVTLALDRLGARIGYPKRIYTDEAQCFIVSEYPQWAERRNIAVYFGPALKVEAFHGRLCPQSKRVLLQGFLPKRDGHLL